jgi:hypothetical protein
MVRPKIWQARMVPVRLVSTIFDHSPRPLRASASFFVMPARSPGCPPCRTPQSLHRAIAGSNAAVQHVARDAQRAPAQRLNLRGHRIHLFLPPRARHHVRARGGIPQRDLAAQAGRPANHHRNRPLKSKSSSPFNRSSRRTRRHQLFVWLPQTLGVESNLKHP